MITLKTKLIMSKFLKSLVFMLLVLLGSCIERYEGEPLAVRNNSDQSIYFWFAYWKMDNYIRYHYPDTILPVEIPLQFYYLPPHNATMPGEADPNWKRIYSELPDGKLSIYFFTELPENQSEWDLIRQTYNLTRKDITLQDLKSNNYVINFP